jgi:threonylcarbamoyladenosine tRNA methylthiotransferase MtaB
MPVAALTTLGCKVNQWETERIAQDFSNAGFTLTDFDAPADVYVINSCSVTASADKKSRYLARKASRTNPDALVVMTGCHSQQVLDAGGWVEGATLLVDNDDKLAVFAKVLEARPDVLSYSSSLAMASGSLPARERRTRQTLKVQDGCTHFCGFCQIPYTRKTKLSRPWTDVLTEAERFAAEGTREIVVTGVCVGAYDEATGSGGPDLAELLLKVADVPGISRVRLSSIQPIEISDSLIEAFASHPNLCPHLHLSCQSGDDFILKAMNRPYDTDFFEKLVEKLRIRISDLAITTDLIVGYPGETEAMHQSTLSFARRVGFQKTHVFRYSPRDKTYADTLDDNVTDEIKKRRHAELQAVVEETNRSFTEKYLGETLPVLVEGRHGEGLASGHTPQYLSVHFPAPLGLHGAIVPVRLDSVKPDGSALGTLLLAEKDLAMLPKPRFQELKLAP